ncbi:radical SAM/SPASM domain-containing protein [Halodesulfovibrio aestuarii]|uniref:radical SAM/SPASM domain-containing protein n=1 Tax=Halodesulfovibrio aestuarii TaxID=126333 RepID=UPI0012B50B79
MSDSRYRLFLWLEIIKLPRFAVEEPERGALRTMFLSEYKEFKYHEMSSVLIDHQSWETRFLSPLDSFVLGLFVKGLTREQIVLFVATFYQKSKQEAFKIVNVLLKPDMVPPPVTNIPDTMNNLFANFIRQLKEKPTPLPYPAAAYIVLTKKCNFRCRYCFFDLDKDQNKELDTNVVLQAVTTLSNMGTSFIYLSGGEPFVHPSFMDIVEMILQKGMTPAFSTNGCFLTADRIAKLSSLGVKSIQVSLDTHNEDMHHYLTNSKNTFSKIIEAIKVLVEKKIFVTTKTVITSVNRTHITPLVEMLTKLGVNRIGIAIEAKGEYTRDHDSELFSPEELGAITLDVERAQKKYGKDRVIFGDMDARWHKTDDIVACGNVYCSCVVHANGDVGLCEKIQHIQDFTFGNIYDNDIDTIWRGTKHLKLVKTVENKTKACAECAACPEYESCGTGCFNLSKIAYDDFFAKDPRCVFKK